jgi:hypothetical protein
MRPRACAVGWALLVAVGAVAGCQQTTPAACPSGQPMCCRSSAECDGVSICFPPAGLGCVVQPLPPTAVACTSDPDCANDGATQVCAQVACDSTRGKNCAPGCASDADCVEGQTCSATHHCVAKACDTGCPPLFGCDSTTSMCGRRACQRDADCPTGGVCVDGGCYATLGQCGLVD